MAYDTGLVTRRTGKVRVSVRARPDERAGVVLGVSEEQTTLEVALPDGLLPAP